MSLTPSRPWLPVCAGTGAPCWLPPNRSPSVTGFKVSQAADEACCAPTTAGMPLAAAGGPPSSCCGDAQHKLLLLLLLPCAGEGCALHPAYASYALNKSSDDVVAQYVSNSLACATATDKGEQQQLSNGQELGLEPLGCVCCAAACASTQSHVAAVLSACLAVCCLLCVLQGSASQPVSATGTLPSATASRAVSCRTMRCCPCSCAACSSSTSPA